MVAAQHVLVCSASAAGSTRQIAERIALRIEGELVGRGAAGSEVRCVPVGPEVELDGVDALVVGSAVHDMSWLPEAVTFLDRAAAAPAPLWLFSVGGAEARGPLTRWVVGQERARIEQQFPSGTTARDHRVFRGVVATAGMPLWGRVFWRLIGGRPGDRRDWAGIDTWACGIAADLVRARRTAEAGAQPG